MKRLINIIAGIVLLIALVLGIASMANTLASVIL